jgi:hypothetical protein
MTTTYYSSNNNLDVALSTRLKVGDLYPTLLAYLWNTVVSANVNFLLNNLVPNKTPCRFRITICMTLSGILYVMRQSSAGIKSFQMNAGNALNANAEYIFDIVVDSGETVNFQTSANPYLLKFSVVEIDEMT